MYIQQRNGNCFTIHIWEKRYNIYSLEAWQKECVNQSITGRSLWPCNEHRILCSSLPGAKCTQEKSPHPAPPHQINTKTGTRKWYYPFKAKKRLHVACRRWQLLACLSLLKLGKKLDHLGKSVSILRNSLHLLKYVSSGPCGTISLELRQTAAAVNGQDHASDLFQPRYLPNVGPSTLFDLYPARKQPRCH